MLDKVLPFLQKIIEKYGTKSIVAGFALYLLHDLATQGLATIPVVVGMVVICSVFFIFRHIQEINSKGGTN